MFACFGISNGNPRTICQPAKARTPTAVRMTASAAGASTIAGTRMPSRQPRATRSPAFSPDVTVADEPSACDMLTCLYTLILIRLEPSQPLHHERRQQRDQG